jgi:hypothetical protein
VFSADRWALTGEAGVFADPFYSPGSDFIGFSNTLISSLIERDLAGETIGDRADAYEQLYQGLFANTMTVYRDQYPLFGNPGVMPVKIVWDYLTYWAFPALAFIQGQLERLALDPEINPIVFEIGGLNARMQRFFRKWDQVWKPEPAACFIDQGGVELVRILNRQLAEPLDDEQFAARLQENARLLEDLSDEIIRRAAEQHPSLGRFRSRERASAEAIDESNGDAPALPKDNLTWFLDKLIGEGVAAA